jgi:YbbR domain-containing protein
VFQNLGIKTLCLLIASLLWLQAAATTDVEEILRLPVRVVGLTDSLTVIGGRLPDTISVRVRGNRLQLLSADLLQDRRGSVDLDLTGMGPGHHRYDVSVLDVDAPGTALDVVPGVSLDIHVEHLVSRPVEIRLNRTGSLPAGFVFVTELELSPTEVVVTGPESLLGAITEVETSALSLDGRQQSFSETVPLVPPGEEVVLRPVEVAVSAGVEPVEERIFDSVPLTVLREEDSLRIELVPPQARVVVRGAKSVLAALRSEDISAVVTIPEGVEGVTEVSAEAVVPDDVISARVEPATFQVLAGADR